MLLVAKWDGMSVSELFQMLLFKNVMKPFAYNKSYKILQNEKSRTQGPVTQQLDGQTNCRLKNNLCGRLKELTKRGFGYNLYQVCR